MENLNENVFRNKIAWYESELQFIILIMYWPGYLSKLTI